MDESSGDKMIRVQDLLAETSSTEISIAEASLAEIPLTEISPAETPLAETFSAENSGGIEENSEAVGKAFCPVRIYRGESLREIPEEANCVYIVECRDGSYYTGWTNHPAIRLQAHNEGRGAKYTKSRRPVHFVYMETYETKEEAMSREFFIKKMKRPEKKLLIAGS